MKATDFSPITEEGGIEGSAGVMSRLRRRKDVKPVGSGYVRILLNENGKPIEQASAGQKYWSHARGWVMVDVRTHSLEYELPFDDPSGLAGFVATVSVTTSVVDAQKAAAEGADSVSEILKPILREKIRHAQADAVAPVEHTDPVAEINALASAADRSLNSMVENVKRVPDWLGARVTAVSVSLDEATKKHRDELVKRQRNAELTEAESKTEVTKAKGDAMVRKARKEGVGDLRSAEQRALERIASDPSPENVDRVMAGLDRAQAEGRAAFVQMLQDAMGKDFFDKGDNLHQMLTAMGPNVLAEIAGAAAPALGTGDPVGSDAKVIDAEVETVEAEAEEDGTGDGDDDGAENEVEENDEDRDWSD